MRRLRPVIAAAAVVALSVAASADAATTTAAAGSATSAATIATLTAAGHTVSIGQLAAETGTVDGVLSQVAITPLAVDGDAVVPAVKVRPESSPVTVAPVTTPAALSGVVSVSSPRVQLIATDGTAGQASGVSTPDGLGSVSVLGMDVVVDGSLQVSSANSPARAEALKALTIEQIALPSLADILAALGVDVTKLPLSVLDGLAGLPLVVSEAVQEALDTARDAVDEAQATLTSATAQQTTANTTLAAAQVELTTALDAFTAALSDAAIPGVDSVDAWNALPGLTRELYPAVQTAEAAHAAQQAVVAAANDAVDAAQAAVDAAAAALVDAIANLGAVLDAGALADTPLVSLDAGRVGTLARVAGQRTADIDGELTGLNVLGVDVIDAITGSSTLDLAQQAQAVVGELTTSANDVMSALSDVLSGATGLVVPAPIVEVMKQTTGTSTDGAFGTADAAVTVLSVRLPAATVPAAFLLDAIADAAPAALPVNVTEIADGVFRATGFGLTVGTLSESARHRPAVITGAPGSKPGAGPAPSGPNLAATGGPYGLAVLAGTVVAVAAVIRRRTAHLEA